MSLLCLIGLHDWELGWTTFFEGMQTRLRTCQRCARSERWWPAHWNHSGYWEWVKPVR